MTKTKKRKTSHYPNPPCHLTSLTTQATPSASNKPSLHKIINPDFVQLAAAYPDFAEEWNKLKQRRRIKQKKISKHQSELNKSESFATHVDGDFNLALTRAVLSEYFQLSLPSLPAWNLCPPIPNRLNYVLWIKDLLHQVYDCESEYFEKDVDCYEGEDASAKDKNHQSLLYSRSYRGMDIGTGASCIYPLLLSSKYFHDDENDNDQKGKDDEKHQWQFLGTDIDPLSIQCAQENINANQLQHKVTVALVPPTNDQLNSISTEEDCNIDKKDCGVELNEVGDRHDKIDSTTPLHAAMEIASTIFYDPKSTNCHTLDKENIRFDFCMTNPPFYSTIDNATKPRSGDGRNRTQMTIFESVYPGKPIGGEVKFVTDMIHDSFYYQNQITWFTAMLGKKSSLVLIQKELELLGLGVGSIRKTEFVQGKTIRWGIAWTFRLPSLRSNVTLSQGERTNFNVELESKVPLTQALDEVSQRIAKFSADYSKSSELVYQRQSENHVCLYEKKKIGKNIKINNKNNLGWSCYNSEKQKPNQINKIFYFYLIDIYITGRINDDVEKNEMKLTNKVTIHMEYFCHFKEAKGKINIIKNQLAGEIGRTNRRWRRRNHEK